MSLCIYVPRSGLTKVFVQLFSKRGWHPQPIIVSEAAQSRVMKKLVFFACFYRILVKSWPPEAIILIERSAFRGLWKQQPWKFI